MTLPSYRRTRGPFVTLYRSFLGVETELAHAFGETAHSALDAVQQEDLLMIAESTEGGTHGAKQEPEMNELPTGTKLVEFSSTVQLVRVSDGHVLHEVCKSYQPEPLGKLLDRMFDPCLQVKPTGHADNGWQHHYPR